METLSHWKQMWDIYISQEFEVYFRSAQFEHTTKKMVGTDQGLWSKCTVPPRKSQCSSRCIKQKGILSLHDNSKPKTRVSTGSSQLNLQIILHGTLNMLHVWTTLEDQIKQAQNKDEEIQQFKEKSSRKELPGFWVDEQGKLWYGDRIWVPKDEALRRLILDEAHHSAYSIHPGSTKMYMDLRKKYWWTEMKGDIVEYVTQCDTCRRVKAEHQWPAGLLQPLHILVWKWDEINMDFIVGLPKIPSGHDHMGYSRPTNKSGTLYSGKDGIQG